MALAKITQVTGRAVHVPGHDLDTDQIIPARFMRCVTFDGLGEFAFYDARFRPDRQPKGHPLDRPERKGAAILVTGDNFGCGSSREHAPQALQKFGLRAIVAGSFAEIFFGNCTTLGIPCVAVAQAEREQLAAAVDRDPNLEVTVDLEALAVRFGKEQVPCAIREGARKALAEGQWDAIGLLLEGREQAAKLEASLPYLGSS
jgi:3-isopropylmalate/(R)-2-methylmalate dehydratase small subunit